MNWWLALAFGLVLHLFVQGLGLGPGPRRLDGSGRGARTVVITPSGGGLTDPGGG